MTKYRAAHTILLLSLASLVCGQAARSAEPRASVTIQLMDEMGVPIEAQMVSFIDKSLRNDATKHFAGLKGTDIPYGAYDFVLKRPGDGPESRIPGHVIVQWPEQLVVLTAERSVSEFAVARVAPYDFVIRGYLQGLPRSEVQREVRIRLSPIQAGETLDILVGPSGEFRIYKALVGQYIMSVIANGTVLQIQQLSFEENGQSAAFSLRLAETPPPMLHIRSIPR